MFDFIIFWLFCALTEATTELVVEESESTVKKSTIIPESPVNQDIVTKGSVVESSSAGTDVCPEVAKKQKTVQSKVHYCSHIL